MNRIITGDCLEQLPQLETGFFHTCVTSPPYFGLRDYRTALWQGGLSSCDHIEPGTDRGARDELPNPPAGWGKRACGKPYTSICGKCGATRKDKQLGLEDSLEAYVANLVNVFRLVRNTLRTDGTLWLNMGDTYQNGELLGVPWKLAFALKADGWLLRSDIVWSKPNPMPESVKNRPTKAHEYLFLFATSKRYYFDMSAMREPQQGAIKTRRFTSSGGADARAKGKPTGGNEGKGTLWTDTGFRNKRDVWTIPVHPFKGAHFATFPPKLVEPCVLAGCPVGGWVLDPFAGACTTGLVAEQHGRNFVGIELNSEYAEMGKLRLSDFPTIPG